MSADLCFTTDSSSFFLSCFRQLPAELAERNSTISEHMVGSKCNLKTQVWNMGFLFLLQIGGLKPPFSTISQLKHKFDSLYLWKEI